MSPFQVCKLSKRSRAELGPAREMGKLCEIILGEATARIVVLVLALRGGWELPLGLAGEVLLKEIVLTQSGEEGRRCQSSS